MHTWGGGEPLLGSVVDQGPSLQQEKPGPSPEGLGTGQNQLRPHIGRRFPSPGAHEQEFNSQPSLRGKGVGGARQRASSAPWHSEEGCKGVIWDTMSWRRDWGVAIFLPTTNKAGPRGSVCGAHGGDRTSLHQTMPSTPGNCISTGAGQTLWNYTASSSRPAPLHCLD